MVRVCCVVCDARSVQKCACVAVRLAWCGSAAPIARAQAHVFPTEQYIAEFRHSNRASFTLFRWFPPLPSRALAGSSLAETEMDDAQQGCRGPPVARGVDPTGARIKVYLRSKKEERPTRTEANAVEEDT